MKLIRLIFLFNAYLLCAGDVHKFYVESDQFYLDEIKKIIICLQKPNQLILPDAPSQIVLTANNIDYIFTETLTSLEYSRSYQVKHHETSYKLYFTTFPVISITTTETIVDDPKIPALISYVDTVQSILSNAGIEIRGGYSQSYPKKTYDLEFWTNPQGTIARDLAFGNLRSDDDWILDALYNEPLRTRSFIAHKLWLKIHRPFYRHAQPDAKAGADVMFVEVFVNKEYKGLYTLSEQIDRELLKLKAGNPFAFKGELYKAVDWASAVLLNHAPPYNNNSYGWSGFEFKYPDNTIDWTNLHGFVDFVTSNNCEVFNLTIEEQFQLDNAIDYFIFLNLLRATDNTGKNIYVARYTNDSPYFYVPWDLDGVLGTIWDGSRSNYTNDILTNGLFNRLLNCNTNNFKHKLGSRWVSLRQNILHKDTLFASYESAYNKLNSNAVLEREILLWNQTHNAAELNYMKTWTTARLNFLDQYFAGLITNTIDVAPNRNLVSMYPSPVNEFLVIDLAQGISSTSYEILNNYGKTIMTGSLSIGSNTINTEHLTEGLYLLAIGNQTQKFIVVK